MPIPRIRRRRPIAWNQLLSKGHAHDVGRTATRRAHRQAIEADLDAYFDEKQTTDATQQGTKDGTDLRPYLGSISNALQICNNTWRSLSRVR